MNRLFELQIIQPKFDETYKKYEKIFAVNHKKNLNSFLHITPGAKVKGLIMDGNTMVGKGEFLNNEGELEDATLINNKHIIPSLPLQIHMGDNIGGDKIEQHVKKNKAFIKKGIREGFLSKFFIPLTITVIGGLIVAYFAFQFKLY